MAKREKVDQRLTLVTRRSQLEAIDEWREGQRPIPSRNEAIRQLIDLGLAFDRGQEGVKEDNGR
jgi:hypothetical protein